MPRTCDLNASPTTHTPKLDSSSLAQEQCENDLCTKCIVLLAVYARLYHRSNIGYKIDKRKEKETSF